MSGESLLRIGPFSRASSLSIKTLRAYHEAGLLVPAAVDPATGYRSYAAAQLNDAAIIKRLRLLDVPLDAIRAVLDARDPAVTKKVLGEHGAVLAERLTATQRAMDELYAALEVPVVHTPAHVRDEPARTVLSISGTVRDSEWTAFLDRVFTDLSDAALGSDAVVAGPYGACYPTLMDEVQDVVAFVPVDHAPLLSPAARAAGVRVDELPATSVAVIAHRGSYDDIDTTYRNLGAWVAANAEPADLPVREHYLVGPTDVASPDDYRTEICWPVRPPLAERTR